MARISPKSVSADCNPLLKQAPLRRRYSYEMWYSCKAGSDFDLRPAAAMSSSDGTNGTQ
jgi:hypothetical protein